GKPPLLDFAEEPCQDYYIPSNQKLLWQKINDEGWAEYFSFENQDYPVKYHCVKIKLDQANLSIITYPSSKKDFIKHKGGGTDFFTGITAEKFSRNFIPEVSINTSPFDVQNKKLKKLALLSSKRKIIGLHIANKEQISAPIKKYGAIAFKKNDSGWQGKIIKSQSESTEDYDFAFGGFFQILTGLKKEEFPRKSHDSRTALGLSEDGKTLFILVVEGEKKSRSAGLSYQECSDIMIFLGASDAIQMDGGGSSSLYIAGKNMLSYNTNRICGVYLGFKKD
ncbi:MAG: phosphodiester glycosidase family protein, partial [Treponema sp.]|nr:phosphodiester glycosidase family protein [Treponema sp.]